MTRRVAVLGAGFIGTHVARRLLDAGIETRVITRSVLNERQQEVLAGATVSIADAGSMELLRPLLEDVDHVVHCAAGLLPAESNRDPAADVRLAIPPLINALELLRGRPGAGLTLLSSGGTVYGPAQAPTIREDHPTNPITSYGVMKLTAEKYVLMYRHLHGLDGRILRCANVFGEHQPAHRSQGVVAAFLDRVARGRPVTVFGDGRIVRDYVYVGDVAMVVLAATSGPGPVIANVGSGEGLSLAGLVTRLEEVTGRPVVIDRLPDRGIDAPTIVLDIELARREYGLAPTPLEEGLRRAWEALRPLACSRPDA